MECKSGKEEEWWKHRVMEGEIWGRFVDFYVDFCEILVCGLIKHGCY